MTITSVRVLEPVEVVAKGSGRTSPKPPPRVWAAGEPPFRGYQAPPSDGYRQGDGGTALVVDNGASLLRAGWAFDAAPRLAFPANVAKFKDRKLNRSCVYVGWDCYADATTRGQIRNAFEAGSGVVANWDIMEGVLDYTFLQMGIDGEEGGIGRPIVMTEAVANLGYSRRMMNELLYECYSAPAVTYAIDALLAYRQNKGRTGLVVSSSHSYTHLIPVVDGRPALASASRLNWGGQQAADYLMKLVKLKYPNLPNGVRLTDWQMQALVREHCYVAPSFDAELARFLDWSGLEGRDHVLQFPFTEHVVAEKTAEELARVAERKKESGRRLQEQAAKMRLDKLIRKEQDLEYFRDLREKLANATKKEIKRLLDEDEFRDEAALDKKIRDLEASIRKARNKDVGGAENEEEQEPPSFPLLDVPDEQLDEASIKQKRHQRLMKSGVEARQRARAEKEAEKARLAEEQRRDDERRETDLPGWLAEKRGARTALVQRLKDQERFKADLGNRKSMASQMRMKTLANLAADQPGRKRRRGGAAGGDDDTFGANDDDWGVYRQVQQGPEASDDSDEEDLPAGLKAVEALLLEHDPDFDEGDTLAARSDWTQSLVHAFLRGPRPFDPESAREAHQVHLNVERIRVPEVVFQPAIAGLDQAGLVEIAADILTQRLAGAPAERDAVLRDVFLTGGNTMFKGFQERLEAELRGVLPVEAVVGVRLAADPLLDAWKGAAGWARDGGAAKAAVSRAEYFEKGSEYLKEHEYGNVGGW